MPTTIDPIFSFLPGDTILVAADETINTVSSDGLSITSFGDNSSITVDGTIDIAAPNALGILMLGEGSTTTLNGTLNVSGALTPGIFGGLNTNSTITIGETGTIIGTGERAWGAYSYGVGSSIDNAGIILIDGDRGAGLVGFDMDITNSGDIIYGGAVGASVILRANLQFIDDAFQLVSNGNASVTNTGSIISFASTDYDGFAANTTGAAIDVLDTGAEIINSGVIFSSEAAAISVNGTSFLPGGAVRSDTSAVQITNQEGGRIEGPVAIQSLDATAIEIANYGIINGVINLSEVDDVLNNLGAGETTSTVFGGAGDDLLLGGQSSDIFDGGDGNDKIRGRAGDDTLSGGAGIDIIRGGAGDDILEGGGARDILFGGPGADIFVYENSDGGLGRDIIRDFDPLEDSLQIGDDLDILVAIENGNTLVTLLDETTSDAVGTITILGVELSLLDLVPEATDMTM